MTRQLDLILKEGGATYDWQVDFEVQPRYLDARCKFWLSTVLEDLGERVPFHFLKKFQSILSLEEHLSFGMRNWYSIGTVESPLGPICTKNFSLHS